MKYSTHYQMNKPENSDQFNVEHFNENTTKIDNLIYTLDQSVSPMNAHITDQNNPHHVTKSQVGLGNVDNTADLAKPISSAMQTALDSKVNSSALGSAAYKNVPTSGNASTSEVVLGSDTRLSDSRPASDVPSWAKEQAKPTYTASEVGAIASSEKGANSGVASLDANGKVPSSQLPSYVDDVIEGYYKKADGKFYKESTYETEITPENDKIYVDKTEEKTYRWSGSAYIEISSGVVLGETENTAYRGDRGKVAYDHSQLSSGNPHNVSASDVGLGNVGNFKAVSTEASQGLTDTEKSNARANIGAGTSNFDGAYSSLTGTPTLGTASALNVASSGDASSSEVVKGDDSRLTDSRTPTSHTHTTSDITNMPTFGTAASLNVAASGDASTTEVVKGDDSRLTDSRTPTSHTHTTSDITNLPSFGTAASLDVATSGDASSTQVVKGDDSRLTDSRTPTSHTHTKSQITDFPTLGSAASLDVSSSGDASSSQVVKGDDSRLTNSRTPTSHTHTVSEITDMPSIQNMNEQYYQTSEPSPSKTGAVWIG